VRTSGFLAAVLFLVSPSIPYFRYERPVQVSGPGQNYAVVDKAIWVHSRPDLGDLRLYRGQKETPYALVTEQGGAQSAAVSVPVLQQSTVAGKTQFLVDMNALADYDHVALKIATKNFVAHATVEGQDDTHEKHWASLRDSILYDLSRENLGSNLTLRLPRTRFKYLRVTLDGPVQPEDVQGAFSTSGAPEPAVWVGINDAPIQEQKGKDTILTFEVPAEVPAERVLLLVDRTQANFRRGVEIQDEAGRWLGSGEISRIHMVRDGRRIDSEDQEVALTNSLHSGNTTEIPNINKTIRVVIHNGDDPPLALKGARLEQLERRIYFDAPAQGQLALYYGDQKLEQPVYDYAKLFQRDAAVTGAILGSETPNSEYTGRPDERPWSERHPTVLWAAIIAAVAILGGIALRSMRTTVAE